MIAPAYPGFDVEVEALNRDPSPIEKLTVPQIISRLEAIMHELESPPILIGHSAAGAVVQVLLDHGLARQAWRSTPPQPKASRSSPSRSSGPHSPC